MTAASKRGSVAVLLVIATLGLPPAGVADDTVTVQLQGEIMAECSVTASATTVDLGDVFEAGARAIPFRVYCNSPFSYEVRSQNGGLKLNQAQTASAGFTTFIPYTVATRIPTSVADIADSCESTALKTTPISCTLSDSANGISLDRDASVTVSWQSDAAAVPIAGRYSDVITLSFRPRF